MDNSDDPPIKRGSPEWHRRVAEYTDKLMDIILEHGHAVQGVMADPLFAYSVGRTAKSKPEIYASGNIPHTNMRDLINDLIRLVDDENIDLAAYAESGEDLQGVVQNYPVRIITCDPVKAEMNAVFRLFPEEDVTAFQMLFPDPDGKFPGEEGYAEEFVQTMHPLEE